MVVMVIVVAIVGFIILMPLSCALGNRSIHRTGGSHNPLMASATLASF
jgi:hypothetical protein